MEINPTTRNQTASNLTTGNLPTRI